MLVFNYTPLLNVIHYLPIQPLVGAVLGFLTIMSGSAIGFHVSRIWYWWYQRNDEFYRKGTYNIMIEEFGLTRCGDKKSIQGVRAIWGYFFHHVMGYEKKSELVKYCQRRWDLFHTFSATIFSILLGIVLGVGFRILFAIQWSYQYDFSKEFVIHFFLILILPVLIYFLREGTKWIFSEYELVSNAIILDEDNRIPNLNNIFPDEYFQNKKE